MALVHLILWELLLTSMFCTATIEDNLTKMAEILMQQQLYLDEMVRSQGGSGLKQMRVSVSGSQSYYSASHGARSVAAIHDHANYINTIGMGEIISVLNGYETRTRHNDYKLVRPHRTSKTFHATEEIPFPDVPPTVTGRLDKQIRLMKDWFRAFMTQNTSVLDYRPYFKPVLCYLEGAWTTHTDELEESFLSDRHYIDASSWQDLQEKIRFTSHSGTKNNLENFAYLPTTIINITDGVPYLAQWNYRILCHPIDGDLPLNRFRLVDDVSLRLRNKKDLNEHGKSRAARYQLNPFDTDQWKDGKVEEGLLDKLMGQIPGDDNYQGYLEDDAFGNWAYETSGTKIKNTAYYHRWYKILKDGVKGHPLHHKGFSDPNVFMAMTSNPAIPKMCQTFCGYSIWSPGSCKTVCQRWTYAIPLEIIYLTPLSKWNPHNIQFKGKASSTSGKTVRENGRNGRQGISTAYNGTNDRTYYMTPKAFFLGKGAIDKDEADTSNKNVWVLNRKGELVPVGPSGIRIMFNIVDVGLFRGRYPIFSIHGEGSVHWKELSALKEIILSPSKYNNMFHEPIKVPLSENATTLESRGGKPVLLLLTMGWWADHTHDLEISGEEDLELKQGKNIYTECYEANGHSHTIKLVYQNDQYIMEKCDFKAYCEHPKVLQETIW